MVRANVILAADLSRTVAQAGVGLPLEGRARQDAVLFESADRCGHPSWEVHPAGWVVTTDQLGEQTFYRRTLDEAQTWCQVWLMFPEIGIGQVVNCRMRSRRRQ